MKNIFRFFYFTGFIFVCSVAVSAQTARPSATPPPGDDTGAVKTFEVRLPVTVTDKKKKKNLITGLTRGDFTVIEDGVPQEVTFFTDEKTNPPVYVGVDKVKKVGSQTALYDAVWQFSDEKLRNAPGRRVIVIITDGDDTFSRAELRDAIDIAQRTETTVFGISTKAGFLGTVPGVEAGTVKDKGDKLLTQLCEQTGGEAFFTGDMLDLEKAFKKISDELRSQYIITYRPTNQNFDGKERKIEVRFNDKSKEGDYKIRTKSSYRAVRDSLK